MTDIDTETFHDPMAQAGAWLDRQAMMGRDVEGEDIQALLGEWADEQSHPVLPGMEA